MQQPWCNNPNDNGKLLKSAGHVCVKSPGHVNVDMSFLFFRSSQLDSSVSGKRVSARWTLQNNFSLFLCFYMVCDDVFVSCQVNWTDLSLLWALLLYNICSDNMITCFKKPPPNPYFELLRGGINRKRRRSKKNLLRVFTCLFFSDCT